VFLIDNDRTSDCIEHLSGQLDMVSGGMLTWSNRRHPLFDQAGSVGHRSHYRNRIDEDSFHEFRRDAGRNRYQQMLRSEIVGDLTKHVAYNLRFDAKQNDLRFPNSLTIGKRGLNPELLLQKIDAFAMSRGCDELLLLHNTGLDHPPDDGFTEFSRANYGDFSLWEHAVPFKRKKIIVS